MSEPGKLPIAQAMLMAAGSLCLLSLLAGCRDEPRKQQSYAPYVSFGEPKVGPVETLDGKVVDDKTSPQEITIAALKAIQEDFKATAAREPQRINNARKVLYQLSAPHTVFASYLLAIPGKEKEMTKEDAIRTVYGWWALGIGFFTDEIVYEHYTMALQVGPMASGVVSIIHEGKNAKTGQAGWIKVSLVKENGYFRVAGMELTQKPPEAAPATQTAPASGPAGGPATAPVVGLTNQSIVLPGQGNTGPGKTLVVPATQPARSGNNAVP
jgi:hypothetical protein